MLASIDQEKIYSYMVIKGACTWEIFTYFILKTADLIYKSDNINDYIFVFDNARIHTSNKVTEVLNGRVNFIFLPPYSPQLNPIENAWSQI